MRLILAIAVFLAAASSALATVAQYQVRGVKANDKLNVRAAPSHVSKVVGRIPHNGREIEIIARGKGAWVKISYGRVQGFVNRRYLALSKPRADVSAAPAKPAAAAADVQINQKGLDAAASTPVAAPVATPVAAPTPATPAPPKLAEPVAPATALPGEERGDDGDTPALMKPPRDLMPDMVPTPPAN